MTIDVYSKSVQLLERIANSIHERDQSITMNLINNNSLCFSKKEVAVVEQWLEELLIELK